MNAPISERDLSIVAAEAGLDPRTVRRVIVDREAPRSEATRVAIVRALRTHGHKGLASKIESGKA